jgi:dTDP-glucose pyrophosphorylase
MDAILPAAGLATRMRGIPKFLLPVDENYQSLLETHIYELTKICNNIFLPTRPDLVPVIKSLDINFDKLTVIGMETDTMSETIIKTCTNSESGSFMLVMPDTYFYGQKPYSLLNSETEICDLACWKIRDAQRGKLGEISYEDDRVVDIVDKQPENGFEYAWGALTFSKKLLDYVDINDPHIGYAVKNALEMGQNVTLKKIDGDYFDCGTPKEYVELLKRTLI